MIKIYILKMECILDELKQFVIKEVDTLDDINISNNYLLVQYKGRTSLQNIISIVLLTNIEEYTNIYKAPTAHILCGMNLYSKAYIVEKTLDVKRLIDIKDTILVNMEQMNQELKSEILIKPFNEYAFNIKNNIILEMKSESKSKYNNKIINSLDNYYIFYKN